MSIYQFNLKGIGNDVQIGKGNARIRSSGDSIKFVKAAHDGTVTFNSIAASDLLDIQTNQISLGSNTLTLNDTGGTSNGGQIAFTRNNANSGAAETLTFSGLNSGSGTTILNVDFDGDITLDSGTKIDIKTTAANGDITILPNGTGDLVTKFGGDTADSKFIIKNNSNTERFVVDALGKITLTQDASASGNAFTLTSADVDSVALDIDASQTTGDVVDITANSLTTGSGLKISSSSANTSSRNILDIVQTGTGGDDSNALIGLNIDFDVTSGTAARALKIDSEQTTGIVAEIDATQVTTGSGMLLSANALTSGNAFKIESSSNSALTSGNLLYISHTGNANTVVGPISEIVTTTTSTSNSFVLSKFTADSITQGKVINVSGNSLTTGVAINLNVNALTSGQGINVASTSTSLTGDLIKFNNSGNDTGVTGDLMDISLTGAANLGKVLNITQSSTSGAASRAVNITSSQTDATVMQLTADSVSTGKVIDITADGLTSGIGFNFESTATGLTGDVIKVVNSGNNSGITGDLMDISLTGAANVGKVLNITQSSTSGAASRAVNITSSQTDAIVMQMTTDSVSTGKVIDITADGLTSGVGFNFESTATGLTGDVIKILNSGNNSGVTGDLMDISLTGAANLGKVLNITQSSTSGAASRAVNITSSQTDATVMQMTTDSVSTGKVIDITADGLTSGIGFNFESTATGLTGDVIKVVNSGNNSGVTGDLMDISLTGAANLGKVLNITQSSTSGASSRSVNITSSQTDATVMQITADSISTGKVIDITADGLTTGSVLNIEVAGSTLTSGNAINVNLAPTSNAANITDYLAKFTTTASTNSGAGIASFVGNSLTTGDAVFINANSNSSGNILHIKGTGIQQKWSYDSDSFATITVADNSDTTFATGESGNLTLDVAQNFTLDADSSGDGSIDIDAGTGGITIDSTSTSAGIKIGTVTSGVPISIGHTTSEVTINDNLTVTGNFTVNGDSITKNVTTLNVEDPLIKLNNYSNSLYDDENDIGFFGQYGNSSGTQYYTGLARARGSKMFYLFSELTPDPEATVSAPGFGSSLDIASNSLSDIKFNASGTASNLAIGQVFRVAQYKRSGWQVNNSSGYSIGETGNISIEQHSSHSSSVVAGDRIYIISSNAMVEVGTVKSVTTDGGSEVISFDGTGTLVALVDNQPLYVLQSDNGTVRVTNATASSYACSIVSAGSGYTDITNASAGTDDTAVGNGTFLEYIYVQNEVVKNITDKASSESSYKASVWADIQGNFINTNSITLSTSDNINLIGKIGLNNILLKRITIKVTTAITGGTALAGIAVFKSSTDGTDKTVTNDRGTVIATNDFIGNIVGTYVIDFDPYVSNNVITSGNYLKLSAVDSSDSINETNVSISAGVVKVFVDYVTYDGTIYE